MARGYPDFFGYSTFPWQGNVRQDSATVNVLAGATQQLIMLTGKRVILNAYIGLVGGISHLTDSAYLDIDGVQVSDLNWGTSSIRLQGQVVPTEPIIVNVIEETFRYQAYFAGIFTVGVSVAIRYQNNSAENRNVNADFTSGLVL